MNLSSLHNFGPSQPNVSQVLTSTLAFLRQQMVLFPCQK